MYHKSTEYVYEYKCVHMYACLCMRICAHTYFRIAAVLRGSADERYAHTYTYNIYTYIYIYIYIYIHTHTHKCILSFCSCRDDSWLEVFARESVRYYTVLNWTILNGFKRELFASLAPAGQIKRKVFCIEIIFIHACIYIYIYMNIKACVPLDCQRLEKL